METKTMCLIMAMAPNGTVWLHGEAKPKDPSR
jgi:hypothetical protein